MFFLLYLAASEGSGGGRPQGSLILLVSSFLQVEVKIVGDSVLLRVDGEEVLRLRQVSGTLVKKTQPIMRIALGGLLFPVSSLRLPVTASRAGTLTKAGKTLLAGWPWGSMSTLLRKGDGMKGTWDRPNACVSGGIN